MRHYTIVYAVPIQGTQNYITEYKHIETNNLKEYLKTANLPGQIWFIFHGHPHEVSIP